MLTLLAGVFMLAAGLLKLGFLTRFISNAVLRGFITGIGVNIILGQLGDLTGYSSEYCNKVVKAIDTFLHLGQIELQIFLVGVVCIVLIVVLDRLPVPQQSLAAGRAGGRLRAGAAAQPDRSCRWCPAWARCPNRCRARCCPIWPIFPA